MATTSRFYPRCLALACLLAIVLPPPDGRAGEEAPPDPAKALRSRLRPEPELALSVDMEPATRDGDMLGAPVDAVLSPDGRYLAVGGKFKVIRFFDARTGEFLCRRPDPRPPLGAQRTLAWVDNRFLLASGSEHAVWVWDAQNDFHCNRAFRPIAYESIQVAWNPARRLVANAGSSGTVTVWNFDAPVEEGRGVMAFGDRTSAAPIRAYCALDLSTAKGGSRINGIAWAPDGRQLAAASEFGVDILDAVNPGVRHTPRSRTLLKTWWRGAFLQNAEIYDMPRLQRLPLPAMAPSVTAYRLSWSPDGRRLAASYGLDRNDSHKKANRAVPAKIRIYNTENWTVEREWDAHPVRVYALEFSPDGTVLAAGGQTEVALWDPATGRRLMSFPAHGDEVTAARWSADGSLLVTCAGAERHDSPSGRNGRGGTFLQPGNDRLVRIWRVAD